MVVEEYQKVYPYDPGDVRYGFQISNDDFGMEGDVRLPGLKPYNVSPGMVDSILDGMEVNFGGCEPGSATFHYVEHGLRQLLLGEKSDWKITYLHFRCGEVRLILRNRKLHKIERILESMDTQPESPTSSPYDYKKIVGLNCMEDDITGWVEVTIAPSVNRYIRLQLSHRRKDIKGEKDFYEISLGDTYIIVKETHRINPARRETNLSFIDEGEAYKDLGSDADGKVMLADITEYR